MKFSFTSLHFIRPKLLLFLVILFGGGVADLQAKSLSGEPPALRTFIRGYCALLRQCDLITHSRTCNEERSHPLDNVAYNPNRCALPQRLFRAGVAPDSMAGWQVYGFLGRRYQLRYELQAHLPIRAGQMSAVMRHLPVAARLLNQILGADFSVTTSTRNRTEFVEAVKGERFRGKARKIAGSIRIRRLVYLGYGTSHILWWNFVGQALLDFIWQEAKDGSTLYRVRIYVSPRTALVNTIMKQTLFRNILIDKLQGILAQLAKGIQRLEKNGPEAVGGGSYWTPKEWLALQQIARGIP